MKSLGNIFGTVARTDVLRALYYQPEPVGLRYLARIADIHPHSAELALAALVCEQLVIYGKDGKRKLYKLNMHHEYYVFLATVFTALERLYVKQNNNNLNKHAYKILPFIEEASHLIAYAKGGLHVT